MAKVYFRLQSNIRSEGALAIHCDDTNEKCNAKRGVVCKKGFAGKKRCTWSFRPRGALPITCCCRSQRRIINVWVGGRSVHRKPLVVIYDPRYCEVGYSRRCHCYWMVSMQFKVKWVAYLGFWWLVLYEEWWLGGAVLCACVAVVLYGCFEDLCYCLECGEYFWS